MLKALVMSVVSATRGGLAAGYRAVAASGMGALPIGRQRQEVGTQRQYRLQARGEKGAGR
ncbi:hypothetical protein GCM10011247_06490 [Pseudomonas plecoglossicida]|nr:hypothetical protein GCM10011247_06490 [Pseudomonas plecoglossicida]